MKKLCISLALIGAVAFSTQGAFAAWEGISSLNPMPYLSYLNPLPYFGIGENKTNFSLNPFKGFKNCDTCARVKKCDECTKVISPTCRKAFAEPYYYDTDNIYVQPVAPRCSSCQRKF